MKRVLHVLATEVIVAGVWVTIGWAAGRLRPLDASVGRVLPAWAKVPGAIAIAAGAAGVLGCGAMLSSRGIGSLPAGERFMPREFVSSGPFRFVRNPMSLAAVVLSVGIALWHGSAVVLALAVIAAVGMHLVVVCVEEPGLARRFGDSYRHYKRTSPDGSRGCDRGTASSRRRSPPPVFDPRPAPPPAMAGTLFTGGRRVLPLTPSPPRRYIPPMHIRGERGRPPGGRTWADTGHTPTHHEDSRQPTPAELAAWAQALRRPAGTAGPMQCWAERQQ